MRYLLNLIYIGLIAVALPWLVYQAVRKGKYREGYGQKFLGLVPRRTSRTKCVWLHAVSVGEVNLLAAILERIAGARPEWECVVSTTTMTGMALAKRKYPKLTVFYCPLDFSWAVKTAIRRVRPDVLVLAELELWPNLINSARRSGARVAVINGRLSEHSARGYGRIRPLVSRLLSRIDLLAVQDETYGDRFRNLGAPAEILHVTGSMKYDGAQTDRDNPATRKLRQAAGFRDHDMVFLAGSTQEPEEALALEAYRQLREKWPELRLVLVPRHPDRFGAVAKMLDNSQVEWERRTDLADGDESQANEGARVLLVDVVGEFGSLVGHGPNRLRGRQYGQPGRPEHDRAGRLRSRRFFRAQYAELPRRGHHDARQPGRGGRERRPRIDRFCPPLPGGHVLSRRPG